MIPDRARAGKVLRMESKEALGGGSVHDPREGHTWPTPGPRTLLEGSKNLRLY